jgi:glycosyltransferase involved in cell wall biosynthesis
MIGNGIRIELYQQPARPPEQVRSELGIAPTDRVVLCVGRLEERKHQADLLEALPELTGELPMQLLLVGTGSDRDRLAERAAALGIPDRVHFLGQRPDIADLLHAADIFALPSRREGVPRAVMEAMAARVPVVATDVVGTREVVKDDVTGLLVPFGEPGALAGALRRVLLDEALATRLVASAHVALTRDWREELVVERVDAAYRSLLDGDAR